MAYFVVTTYKVADAPRIDEISNKVQELLDADAISVATVSVTDAGNEVVRRWVANAAVANEWCSFVNDYFTSHPELTFFESCVIEEN